MSHSTSIGAGLFSDLSIATPLTAPTFVNLDTQAEFDALFASQIESQGGVKGANTFVRIRNVREFPSMGTPPNITNVPTYGQKTSQQIQGQADAPSLEIKVNFVGAEWGAGSVLGDMVGDGKLYVFRFALLNAEPSGYASTSAGLGTKENTVFYWIGKVEAMQITPNLTDSNQATVTLSIQSKFYGGYSIT